MSGEMSGVLFTEQCKIDASIPEMDSVYQRIGRTTRRLAELMVDRHVNCTVEFTVDKKRAPLPPPRQAR
ncbi:hypothetical protein HY490_03495 [Candidatus Woesearchaeota archaeon]|nr:hypothetical protein [Candidatus Woesearchaeota archaeon]